MRFVPQLKGLEIGEIRIQLHESQELFVCGSKLLRESREVRQWHVAVSRQQNWCQSIGEFSQEGWTVDDELDLPKRLKECLQDADLINLQGIKVRHKLKICVALKNPDGHVSEVSPQSPRNNRHYRLLRLLLLLLPPLLPRGRR